MPGPFSISSLYRALLRWIIYRPRTVIVLTVLVSLFFAAYLPRLFFKSAITDFMIDDLPETCQYRAFQKLFGSDDIIRVVLKADDIFDSGAFAQVSRLAEGAAGIPGVDRVIGLPEIRETVELGGEADLNTFADLIEPVTLFRRNLISGDRRTTALNLVLAPDADHEAVIRAVEDLIADAAPLSGYGIGMPVVSKALETFSRKDFLRLPPICFLVIALLLYGLFRNLACLILPVLCVALSLVWTFGAMGMAGTPLSMLTMIVPVFLIAVGTAYSLYICSEYLRQARTAPSPAECAFSTFMTMSLPTLLAVFTTAVGVGSLLVNRIPAIQAFAAFSCVGIISLLILLLTLFPAALALAPLPVERKEGLRFRTADRILKRLVHINLYKQRVALPTLLAVLLLCGLGIFRLQAETNPIDYFESETAVCRHFRDIHQELSGSFPLNVAINSDQPDFFFDTPDHLETILGLARFLETLPGVDKAVSYADYLKLVNYTMNEFDPAAYRIPEEGWELRMAVNNAKTLLGEDLIARFVSPDFSHTTLLLFTHIASSRKFLETRQAILDHLEETFPPSMDRDVTGIGIAVSASSQLLVSGQVRSLGLTLSAVFVILFFLFLSWRVGLVGVATCAFPIVVNFGIMGWMSIRLSVATSLIASIATGIAVDDIVHYLVRYNREFKKDLDKDRALTDTVRRTGVPILFTSLIISVGFSILLFSHFTPTSVFGGLMVVTMVSALVGDLIFLPSVMRHVELVTVWDLLRMVPTLEGITASVADELNGPLNAIKKESEYLKMMAGRRGGFGEEELRGISENIRGQADRTLEVVRRLTYAGSPTDGDKLIVAINDVIADVESAAREGLRFDNIQLDLRLTDPLPMILAHRSRLDQILFNLVANAREAIKEGGRSLNRDRDRRITIRSFTRRRQVMVTVADTGPGIPAHIKDRIFEPFFTTRGQGRGKGLGLTVCREIVRSYGGTISFSSKPGKSTVFRLAFPAHTPVDGKQVEWPFSIG
jgi:hypothetical protein